jgi:hypothetical protein
VLESYSMMPLLLVGIAIRVPSGLSTIRAPPTSMLFSRVRPAPDAA